MSKIRTRDKLLDVAEELFALQGVDRVSIKDITREAGTRLGAINYYFENKSNLFSEVILRRAHIISSERIQLLDEIDFGSDNTHELTTQIVEAFVSPLLRRSTGGDKGWKNYCQLVARTAIRPLPSDEGDSINHILTKEFDGTALRFIECLSRALPQINNQHAHYLFQFMLSCTLYTFTENGRIDRLSGGVYKSSDLDQICGQMTKFIVNGFLELNFTTK